MEIKDGNMKMFIVALAETTAQLEMTSSSSLMDYKSHEVKNIVYFFILCPHH